MNGAVLLSNYGWFSQPLLLLLTLSIWLNLISILNRNNRPSVTFMLFEKKKHERNRSKCEQFVKYNEPNRFFKSFFLICVSLCFFIFHFKFFDFDLCEIQHHRESVSPTFLYLALWLSFFFIFMCYQLPCIDSFKQTN